LLSEYEPTRSCTQQPPHRSHYQDRRWRVFREIKAVHSYNYAKAHITFVDQMQIFLKAKASVAYSYHCASNGNATIKTIMFGVEDSSL